MRQLTPKYGKQDKLSDAEPTVVLAVDNPVMCGLMYIEVCISHYIPSVYYHPTRTRTTTTVEVYGIVIVVIAIVFVFSNIRKW